MQRNGRFQKGAIPDDMPEYDICVTSEGLGIGNLLKQASLVGSTSEAFRMIKQGAVKIDGQRVEDRALIFKAVEVFGVQVGKRKFARVRLTH